MPDFAPQTRLAASTSSSSSGELLAEDRNFFHVNTYPIGGTGPAGGTVFYVTDGGLHGLEASPEVFQDNAPWGCMSTEITGADGTAIGTGAQNTADILAGCAEPGTAAAITDAYTLNGFSDWFLPSKDELNEMYLNQEVLIGFDVGGSWWSSTEINDGLAWTQLFFDGTPIIGIKSHLIGFRPIRAF